MKLPPFEYACPTKLSEAVALLAAGNGDAKLLAGGQSLVPMLAFRLAAPALLVDLRKLPELRKIEISAQGVVLGSMVRWCEILADARLRTAHPLLLAAVAYTILQATIIRAEGPNSELRRAIGSDLKGKASLALYLLGIGTSFVNVGFAVGCYVAVSIIWLIPDRRIESRLEGGKGTEVDMEGEMGTHLNQ